MTLDARTWLVARGDKIVVAADRKLALPENKAKGNDWDKCDILRLLNLLAVEKNEVADVAYQLAFADFISPSAREQLQQDLLDEAGDVLNILRFICSKYGAI